MRILLPFTLCLGAVLASCQPRRDAAPVTATDAATAAAAQAAQPVIRGRAFYLERIALPPDAKLRVQLIDNRLADTPAGVIADQTFEAVLGPPYEFALPYDPAKVQAGRDYGLHASLRDGEGTLWFNTPTRVPVTPGSAEVVKFRLVRATGDRPAPAVKPMTWQCGDLRITTRVEGDGVVVSGGFGERKLSQAPAASGARYEDGRGNEFWNKGREATFTLDGKRQPDCRVTSLPSPWEEAKARGVGFRAVGNEPGWFVEVDMGEAPALRADLDYGQRKVAVARAQSFRDEASGESGFRGKADGSEVELRIQRETCVDDMSGDSHPARARLRVGDRTYSGCGRFLFE